VESNNPIKPNTIAEAVDDLISLLPLKVKTEIARMEENDLIELHLSSLGIFIRSELGLWSGNKALMESCQEASGITDLHEDDASAVIIESLWKELRKTHLIRAVE